MTIFESLLLAHIVGDWIVQTEWQAVNKRHNWRALLIHVVFYHVIVFAVLAARFGLGEPRVYIAVAFLAITHAVLDRQWPVEWLMRTLRHNVHRSNERWLVIVVDQAVHIVLIGLVTLYLAR
jgi:hypothetical protein